MHRLHQQLRNRPHAEDEGGFTLIELLIVIVVLGILAGVVVFALGGVTGQSAQAACNADAKSVEVAVEAYHAQTGTWPVGTTGETALTTVVNGNSYLRTWPANTSHYTVSLSTANPGEVDITPNGATGATNYDTDNGAICSTVS